jgi:hypothetical protein
VRRLVVLLATAVAAGTAAASALASVGISFVPANGANYSHAIRRASAIRLIVVHVTEGTYGGTIAWFRNPHARCSANYVVSREGAITQMVADRHPAWHAGNAWVNAHSVGIEHEGLTGLAGTFTDAEYRASAELVARLMRHYLLPIDRRHLIGHNQVPDPFHPGLFGGYSHHTDPGRYWDWRRYLTYVRSYARGVVPPPRFDVATTGVAFEQTVKGSVPWSATPTGASIDHVDFLVDGHVRDTQQTAPYAFGGGAWDTTRETNGRHVLTTRAVATDGSSVVSTIVVTVKNPPIKILALTLVEGQTVTGPVRLEARLSGKPLRVEFLVDGVLRDTQTAAPYAFGGASGMWDTTQETPGPHTLVVRAIGPTGKTAASRTVHVVVTTP